MAKSVILSAAGQQIARPVRITAIVWTSASAAGDTAVLKGVGGEDIWEGRATGTQTYLGISYPPGHPLVVPEGLELSALSSGRVFIYTE